MAERQTYYNRKEKALRCPSDFLSDISDGMASDKTVVPSLQDQYEFHPPLKQHVSTTLYVLYHLLSSLILCSSFSYKECLYMVIVSIFIERSRT